MKIDAISDVRKIAQAIFNKEFSWFVQSDPLVVDVAGSHARIFYVCTRASCGSDENTSVNCRIHFDANKMWISSLHVASLFRLQGLGRQLVQTAEATARALGVETVEIYPFPSSQNFWRKLGYRQNPRMARVMGKHLRSLASEQKVDSTRYEMAWST